ncbi:70 kDa peptidyl-prolyl isomerase-like [Trichoplusia ni]|uniref:70 kDa peptidyl-prolyl isomerase-like n=2 Tax=Trichoplusia ni TaxID=7111 RepID=A0A7E5WRK4_TRINI|nr:70 kDa peptidyl-prolyl isomerase-like [Trichoplusia ni]
MQKETFITSRKDREIRKRVLTPGDYNVVPYEDARCKITLSDVKCTNGVGCCEIEPLSRIFSRAFDGNVLIGDCDTFIDRDFELILQQMCCGEVCEATMVYKDEDGTLMKEISCKVELREVTEEQLISDWSWERLYEAAVHHKERGVELFKQGRAVDAFRRFNKALKMLIATEPLDPAVVSEEVVKDMVNLKVKLYNNLAHCQLQFNEYDATLKLCNKALKFDPENAKALYRRSAAHSGLKMYEEAWTDIQNALRLDPTDKASQRKASSLKPRIEKINKDYTSVIKKMFS